MSFSLDRLRDLSETETISRVVVADTRGSVPREVGAEMLVTFRGIEGTIGGGALELEAIERARDALADGVDRLDRIALGPGVGQCCGGAVTLLTEVWTKARLADYSGEVVARPLPGIETGPSFAIERMLSEARNMGTRPGPGISDGWMVEPVTRAGRQIWVWGAGHVGRAIVGVLAPLPDIHISWADSALGRFPEDIPRGVQTVFAANPAHLVSLAGPEAEHLVLTYSHSLDLELCHRILSRPFRSLGLIGSQTKWARFRKRLAALGHGDAQISRIDCPIGDPSLGKHPQEIALSVATRILTSAKRGMDMSQRQGVRA